MKSSIVSFVGIFISLIAGILLGVLGYWFITSDFIASDKDATEQEEPLYWVAPMDPEYRRDQPGKSPMGMDLVPVYSEKESGDSPGTIRISPDIVNNLGVRTDIAHAMPLKTEIKTVGYVQYNEDQLVHIHPRVEGWIEKLYVKAAGDPVKEGMPLYDIYSPVLVNAQDELILALERNSPQLIRSTENRMRALKIPQSLIDQIKKTRSVEQTVTIYAPQNGVVDNLTVREGFFVKPGTTILSIGALDEVWVRAEIFERQASLVNTGDRVSMKLDFLPSRTWEGKVDYVYPTLDPTTRTISVRMRFKNTDRLLKPNMFAQITVHGNDTQPTLLIPREALIRTGNSDRVVLALAEGKFKSVEVSVGRLETRRAEILDGLKAGDKIVVSAQFLLDSESSITSDFKRISHGKNVERSVWAEGEVEAVMEDRRRISFTHQPIAAWDWPRMTMDFGLAEKIDITAFKKGMRMHVEITQTHTGRYEITGIHLSDDSDGMSEMDHSSHQMQGHQMQEKEAVDHSMHQSADDDQ